MADNRLAQQRGLRRPYLMLVLIPRHVKRLNHVGGSIFIYQPGRPNHVAIGLFARGLWLFKLAYCVGKGPNDVFAFYLCL